MARKREVILDQDEDIACFEHNLQGKFVRVFVGFGFKGTEGFQFAEGQNYEQITIQGTAYDNLLAATNTKPAGVFRVEDLWPVVDIARANVLAEREKVQGLKVVKDEPEPESSQAVTDPNPVEETQA